MYVARVPLDMNRIEIRPATYLLHRLTPSTDVPSLFSGHLSFGHVRVLWSKPKISRKFNVAQALPGTYLPQMVYLVELSHLREPSTSGLLPKDPSAHRPQTPLANNRLTTNRFLASNPRFHAVSHSNNVPGTNS